MIDISSDERRREFAIWLRTGLLPPVRNADGIELKFNPWHDPQNGRFTFAATGQQGGGTPNNRGGGSSRLVGTSDRPKGRTQPTTSLARPAVPEAAPQSSKSKGGWGDLGFTGGGGGSFGGAGATSYEQWPASSRASSVSQAGSAGIVRPVSGGQDAHRSMRATGASIGPVRTEVRNGYTYEIDERERTRRVSGVLTVAAVPVRSRAAQASAGGDERRNSDDGGHYIAARFNGPTDAFNHFAQDANFNRGDYRVLEDEWAKAKRVGKSVTVKIVPRFPGASKRPSMINVWWTINGHLESQQFPNKRLEKSRGK